MVATFQLDRPAPVNGPRFEMPGREVARLVGGRTCAAGIHRATIGKHDVARDDGAQFVVGKAGKDRWTQRTLFVIGKREAGILIRIARYRNRLLASWKKSSSGGRGERLSLPFWGRGRSGDRPSPAWCMSATGIQSPVASSGCPVRPNLPYMNTFARQGPHIATAEQPSPPRAGYRTTRGIVARGCSAGGSDLPDMS